LRAESNSEIETVGVLDPSFDDAFSIAGSIRFRNIQQLIDYRPDQVFLSVPHDVAFETASQLLSEGISVHLEKPMGRNLGEAMRLQSLSAQHNATLTIGFNYRYMSGVQKIVEDCRSGRFGELVSISLELGHGGSPPDRQSWKLDPIKAGGGCLIDPGVHLLDICTMVVATPQPVFCQTWEGFWETGIEEEAHVLMVSGKTAINLVVSIVRWRSTFRIAVQGVEGYGRVEGRGRSYGVQSYFRGQRWAWQSGRTQAETEELVCTDDCLKSFKLETADVLGISKTSRRFGSGQDGLRTMQLLDSIQKSRLPSGISG